MGSPFNPIRDQVRTEMLSALAGGATMTTNELYSVCPSAVDARDVSRLAYELRKKGMIASGEPVLNALGVRVNSFFMANATDPRVAAAKPIVVERKIPRTVKAKKPAASNPYAQFTVSKPQEAAPRITRDLPQHLQSATPMSAPAAFMTDPLSYVPDPAAAARCLPPHLQPPEPAMSEDPMPYSPDPDSFALEPRDPEAEADIDSDLVDALLELANLEPKDAEAEDVLAMAAADVGEITAAMGKPREWTGPEFHLTEDLAPKKVCQCLRINSLPPLPEGYIYGGIKVWIEARHDVGHLAITTHDEGGGPFCSLKASGHLSFDTGDMVAIGRVADALIKLHESMGEDHA